jgi:hypothetical protein
MNVSIPPGDVATSIARTVREAGSVRFDDQRVDKLMPRQAVFELSPGAGTSHAVTPVTDAARAALLVPGNRVEHLLSTWAGLVDAAGGARLKAVALTDSPAGMRLVDNVAVVDGGIGVNTLAPGRLGELLPQLGTATTGQPAAHQVSNSTRVAPSDALEAWIVVGPDTSADVLHFTGARAQLHESWPEQARSAGRDSVQHQKIAALAAGVLAHEGMHAALTRHADVQPGATFPAALDEARTEYLSFLSDDAAKLADALDVPGAAARVIQPLADHQYGARATWLQQRLDETGVATEPDARRAFLTSTSLPQLQARVGEPS